VKIAARCLVFVLGVSILFFGIAAADQTSYS
jgi:hypothetical protein